MTLSLHTIAQGLGGQVRGNKVVARGPEDASHKVCWKRKRRTLTVWINGDGDIGVNNWRGQDPIATKDWVRACCGLPAWESKKRDPKPLPPLWERNQYLSESLRIARDRKRITFEQFAVIINDLKNAGFDTNVKSRAAAYSLELGFTAAEVEAALRSEWRSYTATERASIFKITYDEYRRLGFRRSGCIEVDAAERRRLTKQRYNAKRRAARAAKRVSKSADRRAPLCPSEKVGTVKVPSSERVVGSLVSRDREPSKWVSKDKIRVRQKSASAPRMRSPENARLGAHRARAPNAAFAQIKKSTCAQNLGHAPLRCLGADGASSVLNGLRWPTSLQILKNNQRNQSDQYSDDNWRAVCIRRL